MKNAIPYILIIVFSLTVIVLVGWVGILGGNELDKEEQRLQEIIAAKGHYRTFYNNQKRFYDETTVAPERREELREFQKAVAASPERESLEQTLSAYHYWLASLPSTERSNLQKELQQADATNSERIEDIKKVIEGARNMSVPPPGAVKSSDDDLAKLLADSNDERKHYLLGLPPGDGRQRLFGELESQKYFTPPRPYGPEGYRPGGGRGGGPGGGPDRGPGGGIYPPGPRPENFPGDDRDGFPGPGAGPRIELAPKTGTNEESKREE